MQEPLPEWHITPSKSRTPLQKSSNFQENPQNLSALKTPVLSLKRVVHHTASVFEIIHLRPKCLPIKVARPVKARRKHIHILFPVLQTFHVL